MLVERKQRILKAIIDDYIISAEPISSKQLVDKHKIGLSSATVRNEMALLEQAGYLEQPYTSAGRIPSEKGYREYVSYLMKPKSLSEESRWYYNSCLKKEFHTVSELIEETAKALAFNTGYTCIAIAPSYSQTRVKQIKLLMLERGKALVLVLLSQGLVKDKIVKIPPILNENELSLIAKAIQKGLNGLKINEISLVTMETCTDGIDIPDILLNQVLAEAYATIKQAENMDTFISGANNLLKHPEFSDSLKAEKVLRSLSKDGLLAVQVEDGDIKAVANSSFYIQKEDEDNFVSSAYNSELISTGDNRNFIKPNYLIRIGQELQVEELKDCSFVSTSYEVGNNLYGKLAIFGPKRMDYEKLISDINFVRYLIESKDRRD